MKFNQLKVGAILSYVSMGLGYIISIVYTPIMLRLLGQSEYGLYNLVASIVAYLGVLNFGFGSAYMRYYSRYKVEEDRDNIARLNGMFLVIFIILGLVAMTAGTILAVNTEFIFGDKLSIAELEKAKVLMLILVINLGISFPNIVFTSNITANEKFIFQKIVQMIRTIVSPLVVLPLLLMGYGSVGMVLSTTLLNILIEIINIYYSVTKLNMKFIFNSFDFSLMREMTVYSSFIFINMIVDQINWNVDKFLLGRYQGTAAVAVYGLAAQLNIYYMTLSSTVSSVFIPRVHRIVASYQDNQTLTRLFTRIGRIQFLLLSLISTGLIFFGRPFIRMWAGEGYDKTYYIVLLLIIPATLGPLIQNIGIEIQRAKNMHQFRSWLYLAIALVNLAISIPLAKAYGGVGVALGTGTSVLVGNGFIMNWYYHSKVGLDMKYFWTEIIKFVPALLAPFTAGFIFNRYFNLYHVISFLGFGVLYVLVFGVSMWLFGMNQYEKDLIADPIRKIVQRLI